MLNDIILLASYIGSHRVTAKQLAIEGLFITRDKEITTIKMVSDFNLINRVMDGSAKRIINQRVSLGFDCPRIWTGFYNEAIGEELIYENIPNFYSYWIPKTVELCLTSGMNPYFTAYTGINDPSHYGKLGEALSKFSGYCFLEYVNEWNINSYKADKQGRKLDINRFFKVDRVLCSHGSNGSESEPVTPLGDFGDFHTNGASEWQRKVGHNGWEFAVAFNRPILASENTRDDNDGSIQHFHDAALGATGFIAGACYHSTPGKHSWLFEGSSLVKAEAWIEGINSIPSYCQRGYYERLEPMSFLRRYRKGGINECLMEIDF